MIAIEIDGTSFVFNVQTLNPTKSDHHYLFSKIVQQWENYARFYFMPSWQLFLVSCYQVKWNLQWIPFLFFSFSFFLFIPFIHSLLNKPTELIVKLACAAYVNVSVMKMIIGLIEAQMTSSSSFRIWCVCVCVRVL